MSWIFFFVSLLIWFVCFLVSCTTREVGRRQGLKGWTVSGGGVKDWNTEVRTAAMYMYKCFEEYFMLSDTFVGNYQHITNFKNQKLHLVHLVRIS